MARLIDADALILALETQDYSGSPESLGDWTPQDLTKVEIADINNAPTIDAEPTRHGKWIMLHKTHGVDEDNDYDWKCSECNHVDCHNINVEVPYCWYCGAKMDGE